MPASRPSAAFEPISPDLDLAALVESTPNFEYVVRIHVDMIDHQGIDQFEKLVLLHVVLGGKPLVIEGYNERLDRWTFALQWLRDNCATKVEIARDLTKKSNLPLTIGHYLNNMALLTNQWTPQNYKDPDRQRIYLKDIDCPPLWRDKLADIIPQGLFYLNESTGDSGGLGATEEPDPHGPGMRMGKGLSKAGDLMSSLPSEMRAENMMCYIGHEGTYTPSHREMCASLGQNIMVETSAGSIENDEPTKAGSSIWFMTETKDRFLVSEYWLSRLGHDIEVENHFAQINAWKAAPFNTYVVEQRVGDFILIPPLAPHQVWNRGTRTMKAAWNRTTVETLEMALDEALPRARMVCRDEQYKNKAIIYFTLTKYSQLIKKADKERRQIARMKNGLAPFPSKIRQLHKDFRRLHALYTRIIVSESFLPESTEKSVEMISFEGNITCSYCRGNIFNRFLTCGSCIQELPNGEDDTYDICMECYAMGRSCACVSKFKWVEQFDWGDLVQRHDTWRHQIIQFEGQVTEKSPKALKTEIEMLGRRTLAQICQLELQKRPFNDIKKPEKPEKSKNSVHEEDEEIEVDDEGRVKRKKVKVRRSEKWLREHKACHLCCYQEPTWKQAHCSCGSSYCYGSLFRGFDMMPQAIMENLDWKCPRCLKICSCSKCTKDPESRPFEPSGTVLGHDTKKIADPRSVENLVDFSYSNIHWLKKAGDDDPKNNRRLKKRAKAADAAKAQDPTLGEHYVEADGVDAGILRLAQQEGIPVDPSLDIPIDPALADAEVENEDGSSEHSDDLAEQYREHPEQALPQRYHGRAPPAPQFVVPEGGVIRDMDHVYNTTEAITYDYPDPDGLIQAAASEVTSNEVLLPPAVATEVPGYLPAAEPEEIEMATSRKRKRPSEGIIIGKNKGKKGKFSSDIEVPKVAKPLKPVVVRKVRSKTTETTIDGKPTLLVKLSVDKTNLEELSRRAVEKASAPVEEAPKVASDLRALNAEVGGAEAAAIAVPVKKVQVVRSEADPEFVISKRRDRRRRVVAEVPVADRQTRARVVEYISDPSDIDEEEGDEGDDDEAAASQSKDTGASRKQPNNGSVKVRTFASFDQDDDTVSSAKGTPAPVSGRPNAGGKYPALKPPNVRASSNSFASDTESGTASERNTLAKSTPSKANGFSKKAGLSAVEIQANRKAKMRAMAWADGDVDDL